MYALFALGIALIFGVMGLMNFAYGELVMVGGYSVDLLLGDRPALAGLAVIASSSSPR